MLTNNGHWFASAHLYFVAASCLISAGCTNSESARVEEDPLVIERNKEAREDSLELAEALRLQGLVAFEVQAVDETKPVAEGVADDAADDPAFWYNASDPASSIVFGSNKKGGIYAYTLKGYEIYYEPVGDVNNIDVRQGVKLGEDEVDLLGGSNRSSNSIVLYSITEEGNIQKLMEPYVIDTTVMDEVYGFCMHRDSKNNGYAIVNGKDGTVHIYQIIMNEENIELSLYRSLQLSSQPEGMVADDRYNILYMGEEQRGIWKLAIHEEGAPMLIPSSQAENNPSIAYDIEGLAIYESGDDGFLIASIQGSFSYAIFDRNGENDYLGSFKITDGIVDGVEETDGLEVVSKSVGSSYSNGILIVQDGFNRDGEEDRSQNFKVVDLADILDWYTNMPN